MQKRNSRSKYNYLKTLSVSGADSWANAFFAALKSLEDFPESHPLIEETSQGLRQMIFKTSQGRKYRTIFELRDPIVYILTIQCPGQANFEIID